MFLTNRINRTSVLTIPNVTTTIEKYANDFRCQTLILKMKRLNYFKANLFQRLLSHYIFF